MMRFGVVCVGKNCAPWAQRCLQSIADQQHHDVDVFIIDDASTDGTGELVAPIAASNGWKFQSNPVSVGAMRNQWDAWHGLGLAAADVVVWVDLDDALAHPEVLDTVAARYDSGALLTYGSYLPVPASDTCPPVTAYPDAIVQRNTIRQFARRGGGLRYNHLRTVQWSVLSHLTARDCQDRRGRWFQSGPDCAVMIPALEMVGRRHAVIDEVLYLYTSDNPTSEWRRWPGQVNTDHRDILSRPPKRPLQVRRR